MDRTWEDEAHSLVSQGSVGNCAGMRLMLYEACWTKGMVMHRHIGKYGDTSLAYAWSSQPPGTLESDGHVMKLPFSEVNVDMDSVGPEEGVDAWP
jgi:hypothetical protein